MNVRDLETAVAFEIGATEQFAQLSDLVQQRAGRAPSVHELVALGAYVREIYQGLENILLRTAKFYGVAIPATASWHLTLLTMFTNPPAAGLPLLIPDELSDRIVEYRGFRHVFHERYSSQQDWERLAPLVESAPAVFKDFHPVVQLHLQQLRNEQSGGF